MVEKWFMDDVPSRSFPIYTRGNAGEVFPDPVSPIATDYTWTGPGADAMRDWLDGYTLELEELDPGQKALFEVFGGHMYMNLSVARLMGARTPGMTASDMDAAYFGTDNSLPPHVPRPLDDDPAIRQRCGDKMMWFLTTTEIPEVDEQQREVDAMVASRPDLATLPDHELVARMREMRPWFQRVMYTHAMVSSGAGMTMGALTGLAAGLGRPGLDLDVSSGLGGVDSAEPGVRLWDIGRLVAASPTLSAAFDAGLDGLESRLRSLGEEAAPFWTAFESFQARFGARGPNEWEPRSPTWGTDAALVLTLLDRIRLAPDSDEPRARHDAAAARSKAAVETFRDLAKVSEEAAGTFELALASTNAFMPARERSKDTIVKIIHEVRLAARASSVAAWPPTDGSTIQATSSCSPTPISKVPSPGRPWRTSQQRGRPTISPWPSSSRHSCSSVTRGRSAPGPGKTPPPPSRRSPQAMCSPDSAARPGRPPAEPASCSTRPTRRAWSRATS